MRTDYSLSGSFGDHLSEPRRPPFLQNHIPVLLERHTVLGADEDAFAERCLFVRAFLMQMDAFVQHRIFLSRQAFQMKRSGADETGNQRIALRLAFQRFAGAAEMLRTDEKIGSVARW